MDAPDLPDDLAAAHALLREQAAALEKQSVAMEMKDRLIEEQAHSVLEMKADRDQLDRKVGDLQLSVEKLLHQLYGRRSERRLDGQGQLYLHLGEEPTPEVVSALEAAVDEARGTVEDAEEQKKQRRRKRPDRGDRKFPEQGEGFAGVRPCIGFSAGLGSAIPSVLSSSQHPHAPPPPRPLPRGDLPRHHPRRRTTTVVPRRRARRTLHTGAQ